MSKPVAIIQARKGSEKEAITREILASLEVEYHTETIYESETKGHLITFVLTRRDIYEALV